MGAALLAANTEALVVTLSSLYIATTGVCINMLSTIVIDLIPTQFRAMAVCLSLMSGRLGVTVFSLAIGFILDHACNAAFILLSVVVLACCLLMYLLPGPPKSID
ncbi:hypothetical protein B7P43_G17680 [Cryptotermes secundus]|uniref:Major facilitator superfamily (MFS) profile domain-containing protein n=1 Tax=Cryptotermes secundus TaxID=105785 RepID=A0A2J7R492_9NEOP|nr:uncharacterized protein LOC111863479 [Cryptotermes secundus]PNF35659.1 hypothetical protein B7P43_G17680 [Cryptotermes secundus]